MAEITITDEQLHGHHDDHHGDHHHDDHHGDRYQSSFVDTYLLCLRHIFELFFHFL